MIPTERHWLCKIEWNTQWAWSITKLQNGIFFWAQGAITNCRLDLQGTVEHSISQLSVWVCLTQSFWFSSYKTFTCKVKSIMINTHVEDIMMKLPFSIILLKSNGNSLRVIKIRLCYYTWNLLIKIARRTTGAKGSHILQENDTPCKLPSK